jgi:hypothetical protein
MTRAPAWRCFLTTPDSGARLLALLASGHRHGPITRLITPWNIGELTIPFVFLHYAEVMPSLPRAPVASNYPGSTPESTELPLTRIRGATSLVAIVNIGEVARGLEGRLSSMSC